MAELLSDCLKDLFRRTDHAIAEVAGETGIDRSLLYKWLRNERVPPRGTLYLDAIAECLRLLPAERKRLTQAWETSLEIGVENLPQRRRQRVASAHSLLREAHHGLPIASFTPAAADGHVFDDVLEDLPSAVDGHLPAVTKVIELLEALPSTTSPDHRILLTYHARELAAVDPDLHQRWTNALYGVLSRGWNVIDLVRLLRDRRQPVRLVRSTLALVGASGRYEPRYFWRQAQLPQQDLIIIPSRVAIALLATSPGSHIDAAIITKDPAQVRLLEQHWHLLAESTSPLLYLYPTKEEFLEEVVAIEARPGDRSMVKHGLSILTRPCAWYEHDSTWGRRHGIESIDLHRWRDRVAAFHDQVSTHHFRDICPKDAIIQFVESGRFPQADGMLGENSAPADEEERIAHLQHVIDLLRRYERYHLALPATGIDESPALATSWRIKGDEAVLMRVHQGPSSKEVKLAEPTIVGYFQGAFDDAWVNMPSEEREKYSVILWLTQQTSRLRESLSAHP